MVCFGRFSKFELITLTLLKEESEPILVIDLVDDLKEDYPHLIKLSTGFEWITAIMNELKRDECFKIIDSGGFRKVHISLTKCFRHEALLGHSRYGDMKTALESYLRRKNPLTILHLLMIGLFKLNHKQGSIRSMIAEIRKMEGIYTLESITWEYDVPNLLVYHDCFQKMSEVRLQPMESIYIPHINNMLNCHIHQEMAVSARL